MKFRTEYTPEKSKCLLSPHKPVVLVGSCFSQNIAAKMQQHSWEAVNPLGTIYNPFSISFAIDIMLDEKTGLQRFEKSLFQFEGIWNSNKFDSSFSSLNRNDCIDEFMIRRDLFLDNLSKGRQLIITFGTSFVYYLKDSASAVGNCHKLPADRYYRQRLTPSEILADSSVFIEALKEKFPDIKIIFTVSPVRHLKDGFAGNSKSKAILLLGVEETCKYNENCFYFPAFEIVNDDLRDYRFYASDLVHPSDEAVEYVWEKFVETYIDEAGKKYLENGSKEFKALNHRPKTGALGKPLIP